MTDERPASGTDPVPRLLRAAGARPSAPHERSERVRAAVEARWRDEVRSRSRRRLAFLWAAGCAAAAALVLAVIGHGGRSPLPIATVLRVEGSVRAAGAEIRAGDRLPSGVTVATGPGGRAAVEIAGLASARLDGDTRVVVDAGPVLRLLQGAVYVDSGARARRPGRIVVRTEIGEVRDIGTRFEVRVRDGALQVSVREGIARLIRAVGPTDVRAGTRLLVAADGALQTRDLPAGGPDWDWVQEIAPAFVLEGRTLGDYLDWVSRETGWTVRFADPSIARQATREILHGSLASMRPDETPAAVLPTCGLRHHVTDGTLFVERAEERGVDRP